MPLPRPRQYTNVLPPLTTAGVAGNWRTELDGLFEREASHEDLEAFIAKTIKEALAPFTFHKHFVRGDAMQQERHRAYNATIAEVERIRLEQVRRFVQAQESETPDDTIEVT